MSHGTYGRTSTIHMVTCCILRMMRSVNSNWICAKERIKPSYMLMDGKQYIAVNNFKGGEFISFSLKGDVNRLRTMYSCNDDDDDDNQDHDDRQDQQDDGDNQDDEDSGEDEDSQDDEDEEDDDEEEDDDDGPLSSAIFSERIRKLTRDETMNITAMLPSSVAFVGKPFVHRLSKTNVMKKIMVR